VAVSTLGKVGAIYRRGLRRIRARSRGIYSNFDEQIIIQKYLAALKIETRVCVDIAAGNGVKISNTYSLFKQGWTGLAVEYGPRDFASLARSYRKFSDVNLAKCKVTPPNVVSLLKGNDVPKNFSFLSLDIDSYDYFVLEQILREFRPSLICAEINEKIPPPLKFTVKWDPHCVPTGTHCYGQSISQMHTLCPLFGYSLVEVHYNNAFLIPNEINPYPSLTPEDGYRKGYLDQPDRKERFPWNANMEEVLRLPPEQAANFVNEFFSAHKGMFVCSL
jgi:hypothetical protein